MKNDAIIFLEKKIADSEKRISRLQKQANDPEIWLESGYYLQQAIDGEMQLCSALYDKLYSIQ